VWTLGTFVYPEPADERAQKASQFVNTVGMETDIHGLPEWMLFDFVMELSQCF
jgi:hypothetical protein